MLQQITREHIAPPRLTPVEPCVAQQFDAHPIEPELLGVRPRWLRRSLAGRDIHLGVLLPFVGTIFWSFTNWNPVSVMHWLVVFVSVLVIGFGIGNWLSETRQARRRKALLRRGLATPAIVSALHRDDSGVTVEYVYRTPGNDIFFNTVTLSNKDNRPKGLQVGSTFTALVLPEDSRTVMPYFLAREYVVRPVEASVVSQKVTANIRAQAMTTLPPVSSRLGSIEPELSGATPRTVRHTSSALRSLTRLNAGLAAIGTFVLLCGTPGFQTMCVFVLLLSSAELIRYLAFYRTYRVGRLLGEGVPTRAIIISASPAAGTAQGDMNPHLYFTYQFETREGVLQTGTFTQLQSIACGRNLYEGTTLTVLYDAKNPNEFAPYFTLTGGEIPGATGAKITPPPQQAPLSPNGLLP